MAAQATSEQAKLVEVAGRTKLGRLAPFVLAHRRVVGLARTGRLITGAVLVLFLSFVALASNPVTFLKVFATGLGAGIALDAIVVRSLLAPALVSLFGRANWWLPGPLGKLLRQRHF